MATDIRKILENLHQFYKFTNQSVISVGAGGGQMIEYGRQCQKVNAIDTDIEALDLLKKRLQQSGLSDKYVLTHSDFLDVNIKGDIVMFEFCLHEMNDPEAALLHAMTLAPRVLICDHWPGSEWAHIVDETEKVEHSWQVLKKFPLRKFQHFDTLQSFQDYQELYNKVSVQGARSVERIKPWIGRTAFSIPMSYGFALI
jgi:ubiquinone/menaquinone biosynthesis C-methylase UbiE